MRVSDQADLLGPPEEANIARAEAAIDAANAAIESLDGLHVVGREDASHRRMPRHHDTSPLQGRTPLMSGEGRSDGPGPLSGRLSPHVDGRSRPPCLHAPRHSGGTMAPAEAAEAVSPSDGTYLSTSTSALPSYAPPRPPESADPSSYRSSALGRLHHADAPRSRDSSTPPSSSSSSWELLPGWLKSRMDLLRRHDGKPKSARTVSRLKQVLETFTDVTRYPRCEWTVLGRCEWTVLGRCE